MKKTRKKFKSEVVYLRVKVRELTKEVRSLQETLHLFSSPGNAKRLLSSVQEVRAMARRARDENP